MYAAERERARPPLAHCGPPGAEGQTAPYGRRKVAPGVPAAAAASAAAELRLGSLRGRAQGYLRRHNVERPSPVPTPPTPEPPQAAPPPAAAAAARGCAAEGARHLLIPLSPRARPSREEEPACLYDPAEPQVVHIEGPVMLTAPHGLEVWRGGQLGERRRVHLRERWVTELVLKLSQAVGSHLSGVMLSTSFVVWNAATARKQDEANLDPNYLTAEDLSRSPWNRALREWREAFAGTGIPLLHVDLHGKLDRKDNLEMDVGTGALEAAWPDQQFTQTVKSAFCSALEGAFEGRRRYGFKQLPFAVQRDPELKGHNSRGFHTMSHQSVLLGVPAVQLELPRTMRRALLVEHVLFDKFAAAIAAAYRTIFGAAAASLSPARAPSHYPAAFAESRRGGEPPGGARGAGYAPRPVAAPRPLMFPGPPPPFCTSGAIPPASVLTRPALSSSTSVFAAKGLGRPTRAAALCRQLLRELDQLGLTGTEDKMI
eukprot:TRINITY_DN4257_c1_g1_i2.p2 TRINITY_DN4257_c1_g1~~TRINITY_DN4257_c1_g1_i2.p2  ORF type:complete len:506 (+),score=157.20 TRINITY_DN4257_c1_g1_i2:63-1520(+)